MANKDPAVLFYTSDFLAGTSLMTMKERGQYITLLCLQRERGHMTMKELEKAAGKLSDEVKSKFVQDEDGKYFNRRMDIEIEKRDAHCKKQRENVAKRWNKKKEESGINSGTPSGNTMVLPLGNGNGNKENISLIENLGYEEETPPHTPPVLVVSGARPMPTLEQVKEYALARKSTVDPKEFFEYYDNANWRDAEGKPVYSWQQKFIAWEMRDKKTANPLTAKKSAMQSGDADDRVVDDIAHMQKYLERLRRGHA